MISENRNSITVKTKLSQVDSDFFGNGGHFKKIIDERGALRSRPENIGK